MKQILAKYIFGAILLGLFINVKGQDPQFSQFYNNFMYYNPATTGMTQDLRISSSYRNLWKNIPGDLSTYFVTIDHQLRSRNIGLGFLMFNNNEGQHNLRNQRYEMFYSYRIEAKNKMLQFGATIFSLNIRDFNRKGFVFSDQLDPIHGVVQESAYVQGSEDPKLYPDWNVGLVYRQNFIRNRQYFLTPTIGFSASHIFRPNISLLNNDVRLPVKYVVHGSFLTRIVFNKSNTWKRKIAFINPGFIYENQNPFKTFTIGTGFDVFPMRFGMWFRNNAMSSEIYKYNSVIFLAGFVVPLVLNHNLMIDYTYDSTVSKLEFSTGGAHEITLIYNISLPEKQGAVPCFKEWWRLGRGIIHYSPE